MKWNVGFLRRTNEENIDELERYWHMPRTIIFSPHLFQDYEGFNVSL